MKMKKKTTSAMFRLGVRVCVCVEPLISRLLFGIFVIKTHGRGRRGEKARNGERGREKDL